MEDEYKEMLKAVHNAVVGDPKYGHKGLVAKVDENSEKIATVDKKIDKTDKKLIVFTGIGTGIFGVLGKFFERLL